MKTIVSIVEQSIKGLVLKYNSPDFGFIMSFCCVLRLLYLNKLPSVFVHLKVSNSNKKCKNKLNKMGE